MKLPFQVYLGILVQALLGTASFRVGSKTVTLVHVAGNPVHFTSSQAIVAATEAYAGLTGTAQIGSIQINIQ